MQHVGREGNHSMSKGTLGEAGTRRTDNEMGNQEVQAGT